MYRVVTFCLTIVLRFHSTWAQFDSGMSGDRSVIVQLFEWPYNDIKEECKNVLGPQGFGGLLTSPICEHALVRIQLNGKAARPWYEIYQPVSWNITNRFGTEEEFRAMVEECNKNDVRVYVDAVFNHASGGSGTVKGVGGTISNLDIKNYPGLGYDESNFHPTCALDEGNKTSVRICELVHLQDVNTTQVYVEEKIATFLNKLIGFGVAGFRIDAAKHIWPEDLVKIYNRLNSVSINGGQITIRPYWMLEVTGGASYQDDYKDVGSEYEFDFFAQVTEAFKKGTLPFSTIYEYAKNPTYVSKPVQAMSTNHDTQRFTWTDGFGTEHTLRIQQMVETFVLTFPKGVPNIFSGFDYSDTSQGPPSDESERIISPRNCSHGWTCEHRFKPLQWVVKYFTNYVQDEPISEWWSNWKNGANQAAFTRGQKGFAVFNADTNELRRTFKVSLPPGTYCDLATGFYSQDQQTCVGEGLKRTVEVKEDGTADVSLPAIERSADTKYPPAYLVISGLSRRS